MNRIPFKREVLIAILVLLCIYLNRERVVQRDNYKRMSNNYIHKDSVKYETNKLGNEVAISQILEFKASEMRMMNEFNNLHKEVIGLKKNLKNLEQLSRQQVIVQTNTVTKLVRDTVTIDSVITEGFTFSIENEFESTQGKVDVLNKKVQLDSYQKIDLKTSIIWRRKWLFGKKRFEAQTTSNNPNVKIGKNSLIKVKKK